jgi:type III polyketide synthase
MALGLELTVDRTLLHGVGCAGGLSALRLANSLAQLPPVFSGNASEGKSRSPRILVVALEVTSTLVRSELEELDRSGGKMGNVGVCLFSDGASAMVVGGGELLDGGECRARQRDEVQGGL